MNELEKAKKVIESPDFKVKTFAKENNVNNSTLYKYMANPEKMSSGVWDTIHKLALYYDELHYRQMLSEIEPYKIHDFETWLKDKLPEDKYGKQIRDLLLKNRDLYFEVVNSK